VIVPINVCEPDCQDPGAILWRGSASLTIGAASTPSTPATAVPQDEAVQIPDLAKFNLADAEGALLEAGLRIEISGDSGGVVERQFPVAGAKVPRGTVVLVTLSGVAPPVEFPTGLVLAAIAAVLILAIGGTALTIRQRIPRPEDPKWVDKHVSVVPQPNVPSHRTESINLDDVDFEIKVVATAPDRTISILEVQR
jgi:PASTA domain